MFTWRSLGVADGTRTHAARRTEYTPDAPTPGKRPRPAPRFPRSVPRIAPGILALILSACGGGGASPAPACIPVAVTIQLEGDSISVGTGATDPAWTPPALLRAAFPGVPVLATGLPGSTSFDRISGNVIVGQGTRFQPFPGGVVGNVYVTEFGVNDAHYSLDLVGFKANIRRIASVPGAVLMTPTPIVGTDDSAYAQAVRDVGKELGVPVIDAQAYVLAQPNWQQLLVDGIHPGDALYRLLMSNLVVPAVAKQVAILECR